MKISIVLSFGLAFVLSPSKQTLLDKINSLFDETFDAGDDLDLELRQHSHRAKRQEVTIQPPVPLVPAQIPGFVCTADLFRRMNECCKVPQLYPDSINSICTPQYRLQKVPLLQGVFGMLFPPRLTYRRNLAAKNKTIKSTIEDICRVHCIFKQQRWLTPENFIDENLLYATLPVLIPSGPFNALINHARAECSSIQQQAADIFNSVNNTYGQKCYINPFRLLRCIKRSMILAYNTCPGQLQYGQKCDLAKTELRACDIFSV